MGLGSYNFSGRKEDIVQAVETSGYVQGQQGLVLLLFC